MIAHPFRHGVDAPVSSPYGPRVHPVTGQAGLHQGVDFAAPKGTPIYGPGDGWVMRIDVAGIDRGITNGHAVGIVLASGGVVFYCHLQSPPSLRVEDKVTSETLIGHVGSSGRATGPHLHLAVYQNGRAVDPEPLLIARGSCPFGYAAKCNERCHHPIAGKPDTFSCQYEDGNE